MGTSPGTAADSAGETVKAPRPKHVGPITPEMIKATGLSYAQIAEAVGVCWETVRLWIKGKTHPTGENRMNLLMLMHSPELMLPPKRRKKKPVRKRRPRIPRERLDHCLKVMGWSQRRCAKELGIPQSTWSQWKTGRTRPPKHVWLLIDLLIEKYEKKPEPETAESEKRECPA